MSHLHSLAFRLSALFFIKIVGYEPAAFLKYLYFQQDNVTPLLRNPG